MAVQPVRNIPSLYEASKLSRVHCPTFRFSRASYRSEYFDQTPTKPLSNFLWLTPSHTRGDPGGLAFAAEALCADVIYPTSLAL